MITLEDNILRLTGTISGGPFDGQSIEFIQPVPAGVSCDPANLHRLKIVLHGHLYEIDSEDEKNIIFNDINQTS